MYTSRENFIVHARKWLSKIPDPERLFSDLLILCPLHASARYGAAGSIPSISESLRGRSAERIGIKDWHNYYNPYRKMGIQEI